MTVRVQDGGVHRLHMTYEKAFRSFLWLSRDSSISAIEYRFGVPVGREHVTVQTIQMWAAPALRPVTPGGALHVLGQLPYGEARGTPGVWHNAVTLEDVDPTRAVYFQENVGPAGVAPVWDIESALDIVSRHGKSPVTRRPVSRSSLRRLRIPVQTTTPLNTVAARVAARRRAP